MPGIHSAPAKLKRRLATAALVACSGLLLVPAAGQAAQVFGSGLFNQPTERACETQAPCTVAGYVEIPAPGIVARGGAPIDGVVTKFRIRAKVDAPTPVTFRLADVTPNLSPQEPIESKTANATGAGTGPTVTLQQSAADGAPQEFAARLPVRKGQRLALDVPPLPPGQELLLINDSNDAKFTYEFAPPLVDGAAPRTSSQFFGELLVQGVIEPDADGDGFGDETQDGCPSQKTAQGACDLTKPTIAKLRVRKGKISYTLSEAATVKFRLARKNARGKFKAVGRPFTGPGAAGPNRRSLPRAGKLGPGNYRLSGTATDVVGNAGAKKTVFRIKG